MSMLILDDCLLQKEVINGKKTLIEEINNYLSRKSTNNGDGFNPAYTNKMERKLYFDQQNQITKVTYLDVLNKNIHKQFLFGNNVILASSKEYVV